MCAAEIAVLLVEDDPDDELLVREMLGESESPRFNVTRAGRLSEGVDLLHQRQFDVVLLDLSLPDSRGIGTLGGARTGAPEVPIVVLTGLNDQALAIRSLQSGAQDYLVKGQDTSVSLARAIRYAIARKRLEDVIEHSAQWEQQSWARAQEMRDYRHYVAMSKDAGPGPDASSTQMVLEEGPDEEALHTQLPDYRQLIGSYLRADGSSEGRPVRQLRELAKKLVAVKARSRDVVRLHLGLLAELSKDTDPVDYQDFLGEARLVLVELIGALADRYLAALLRSSGT